MVAGSSSYVQKELGEDFTARGREARLRPHRQTGRQWRCSDRGDRDSELADLNSAGADPHLGFYTEGTGGPKQDIQIKGLSHLPLWITCMLQEVKIN